jgi:hypothetical protein
VLSRPHLSRISSKQRRNFFSPRENLSKTSRTNGRNLEVTRIIRGSRFDAVAHKIGGEFTVSVPAENPDTALFHGRA